MGRRYQLRVPKGHNRSLFDSSRHVHLHLAPGLRRNDRAFQDLPRRGPGREAPRHRAPAARGRPFRRAHPQSPARGGGTAKSDRENRREIGGQPLFHRGDHPLLHRHGRDGPGEKRTLHCAAARVDRDTEQHRRGDHVAGRQARRGDAAAPAHRLGHREELLLPRPRAGVQDGADLGVCIEKLEELQILRHRMRLDEIEFLFKHVLVQETIYRSILFRNRKEIHLNVARAIEELFAGRIGEFGGVLAYHYMQAEESRQGREVPRDGGEGRDGLGRLLRGPRLLPAGARHLQAEGRKGRRSRKARPVREDHREGIPNKGLMQKAVEHYDAALEHYGIRRKKRIGKAVAPRPAFSRS